MTEAWSHETLFMWLRTLESVCMWNV